MATNNVDNHAGASSGGEIELDDLNILNFPPEIDWSSTLVLRCDPSKAPYTVNDIYKALYNVVRRNSVYNLGSTALNYAFTISFKNSFATENFIRYLKSSKTGDLKVKNLPVLVSRVPNKCVTVTVRWIPVEVDSAAVIEEFKVYGTIVKTELLHSDMKGWFHVYNNERRFSLLLHKSVSPNNLPYTIDVKGLIGAVHVLERDPKCLECYNSGHKDESCKYEGCLLFNSCIVCSN